MTSIGINMRKQKYVDKYLLNFFMQCNSLKDLLEILGNVCSILELKYLNKRTKHFQYFQYTFFGLMERVKTVLQYMLFKAESLKETYPEVNEIYPNLLNLRRGVDEAGNLIKKKEMKRGQEKIIEVSQEYAKIFCKINKLIEKYT